MVRFMMSIRYDILWVYGTVYDEYLVCYMMGTWYGTLLISEYGITILLLMVIVVS